MNFFQIQKIKPVITFAWFCIVVMACNSPQHNNISMNADSFIQGTFGYDLKFVSTKHESIVLSDSLGKSKVMIIPQWQARVLTSTASGDSGFSFGWMNYKLISSGKPAEHINAFGGEERLWLGPEGGPFSLYFKPGVKQEFANWYVPDLLDTLPFDIVSKTSSQAVFTKKSVLTNYSGTKFTTRIDRQVRLMSPKEAEKQLDITLSNNIKMVGYETKNSVTNEGTETWSKKTGTVSIWMLSMLNPSPEVTVFLPYREESKQPDIVHDDYFGKVPSDRLLVKDGMIWFKADGKHRSKIGIPPGRAMDICGSYDARNKVLTILWCQLPGNDVCYVNSKWGKQKDPFSGDVINSYNDGPVEDGTQMGPFYEIESSSPAAFLKPGETITHLQRIFHFEGSEADLSEITHKIFGFNLTQIKLSN
jgi:hypothetical protein